MTCDEVDACTPFDAVASRLCRLPTSTASVAAGLSCVVATAAEAAAVADMRRAAAAFFTLGAAREDTQKLRQSGVGRGEREDTPGERQEGQGQAMRQRKAHAVKRALLRVPYNQNRHTPV